MLDSYIVKINNTTNGNVIWLVLDSYIVKINNTTNGNVIDEILLMLAMIIVIKTSMQYFSQIFRLFFSTNDFTL